MYTMKRHGFTMIELVFVIVVLGILAAVAIPRFSATRDDAEVAKARSDISSIRASIVAERQSRLLQGSTMFIDKLHDNANANLFTGTDAGTLIPAVVGVPARPLMQYGIATRNGVNGHWQPGPVAGAAGADGRATWDYTYRMGGVNVVFTYTPATGMFTCNRAAAGNGGVYCRNLID